MQVALRILVSLVAGSMLILPAAADETQVFRQPRLKLFDAYRLHFREW